MCLSLIDDGFAQIQIKLIFHSIRCNLRFRLVERISNETLFENSNSSLNIFFNYIKEVQFTCTPALTIGGGLGILSLGRYLK